jgi:hypothetical protein
MKDLPAFRKHKHGDVVDYISEILINENSAEDSCFIDLLEYEDGHYRVLFKPRYFSLQEGQTEPTKSQWNSLKKKMKRRDIHPKKPIICSMTSSEYKTKTLPGINAYIASEVDFFPDLIESE